MKRTFGILITTLMIVSCGEKEKDVTATGVTMHQTADPVMLPVGETLKLKATVEPSDASQKIVWSTDMPGVATVVSGVVTGILPGTAVVTATTIDGARSASVNVQVIHPLSDIVFLQDAIQIPRGTTTNLTFVFVPHSALNKVLEWKSNNPSVVSIDVDSGEITANEYGTAIITATSRDDESITAACEVEVIPIRVAEVKLSSDILRLISGKKGTLSYTVLPEDAENKVVTWSSSDESIATVDVVTGEVTAVSPGRATITATSGDGPSGEGAVWIPDLSNLGANILQNPSFELPAVEAANDAFTGWTKLSGTLGRDWLQNYPPYKAAGNTNNPGANVTLRVWNTQTDFTTGIFNFFTFEGKYACRVNGNNGGGIYQEGITVTPGKTYYISAVIAYRPNGGTQAIHPAVPVGLHPVQSVKILSMDGMTLHHAVPIVTDPTQPYNLLRPEGLWTVPEDFNEQVRFSIDQPNPNAYGPVEQRYASPIMLMDDCYFQEVAE
ncbi:MAG: Ig-like domain-containing protein [Bacteroidales bacterium]|jgi:uncharacterized protein YjdB|nr:Ig-like domain-containing protein [Bacteroidales bacterium]